MNKEEIEIDGQTYVKKDSLPKVNDEKIVMIRTYSAGVHFGILKKKESTLAGMEVELLESRRVYAWSGAATLSQLSVDGTSNPDGCKFPCKVPSIELVAIEIMPMTEKAVKSLYNVAVWAK